jgi:hypothetical protein
MSNVSKKITNFTATKQKQLIIGIMKLKSIFLLATASVVLICCKGPEGPAGIDGNANVKVYVYNNLNWNVNNGVATVYGSCVGITSDIMNTGAVLAYASKTLNGITVEWLLPWTFLDEFYTENVMAVHLLGEWFLKNESSDGFPSVYLEIPKLKIVVIEGLSGKKEGIELNYTWEELVRRYPNMEYIYVN